MARFGNVPGVMEILRYLIILALVLGSAAAPARAQSASTPRLNLSYESVAPQRTAGSAAALHPAAKGAIIGAAIGAGSWAGIGLWYCTIGPNEVGECGISQWTRGLVVWGAVGAGSGLLIGAIR